MCYQSIASAWICHSNLGCCGNIWRGEVVVSATEFIGVILVLFVLLMAIVGGILAFSNKMLVTACEERLVLRSDHCEIRAVPVIKSDAHAANGEE